MSFSVKSPAKTFGIAMRLPNENTYVDAGKAIALVSRLYAAAVDQVSLAGG